MFHVEDVSVTTTPPDAAERDRIDARIGRWAEEIPGLDLATEAITQRIYVLQRYLERSLAETSARFGLGVGEYRVLSVLSGAGPPYRMSPSRLSSSCVLSSGAMTNRLDNLERAGLVERLPDPTDRRALQVALTDAGKRLWDEMVGVQAEREALVASTLDNAEKEQLNTLLRRLVLAFEREHGPLKKTPPA